MMFKKDDFIENGFKGFYKVRDIREGRASIPPSKGVYIVYRDSVEYPQFLKLGTGGLYSGNNPNVEETKLKRKWVEGANLLYIGETGSHLNERIELLVEFGDGHNVRHWGGRYIWQLLDSSDLLIAYKIIEAGEPINNKKEMLEKFIIQHNGRLPFANLKK